MYKQLTLGDLINFLEKINPKVESGNDKYVYFNFEYLKPTKISSWRGDYSELSIEFDSEKSITVVEFLSMLKSAVGKEFVGYKGGEFEMSLDTRLWVANYGNSGDTGIIGVTERSDNVILLTDYCEY